VIARSSVKERQTEIHKSLEYFIYFMFCKQTTSQLQMELEGLPLTIFIQLPSGRTAVSTVRYCQHYNCVQPLGDISYFQHHTDYSLQTSGIFSTTIV